MKSPHFPAGRRERRPPRRGTPARRRRSRCTRPDRYTAALPSRRPARPSSGGCSRPGTRRHRQYPSSRCRVQQLRMPLMLFSQTHIHTTRVLETQFDTCELASSGAPSCEGMPAKVRKAVFPPPGWAPVSCPPPRRSPRRCCPSSTSRSSSTASRRRCTPGFRTSSSSPAAASPPSRTTSTSASSWNTCSRSRQKNGSAGDRPQLSDLINVSYIRQKEALGLGHAVLRAARLVGDEPFAVVLADDVIDAETPCIAPAARRLRASSARR